MNRALLLRSILAQLRRARLRTTLMTAVIAVSVLATVLLQGAAVSVRASFDRFIARAYPADGIVLMAGGGFMGGRAGTTKLRLTDVETVAASIGVTDWDPMIVTSPREVKRGGASAQVSIRGHSEKAESIRARSVIEGEFFTASEVRNRANVALIGTTTAATLFPDQSPVGARIFVDNVPFEVRGVLEPAGVDPHGGDQDQIIQIPFTTLMDRIARVDYVSAVTFVVADRARMDAVRDEILDAMRQLHQIAPGQEDDFVVITPVMMNAMLNRSFRTFDIFVPAIAVTAFAISAGVILSIMQLGMRARTAEIGLCKAVGARDRDLLVQVVLEVAVVSVAGAVTGLLLATASSVPLGSMLAAKFGATGLRPSFAVSLLAAAAALGTGLAGALLPARRAARLDPVRALR